MSDTPLASLSLTHVVYNPFDPLAHACAWLALVPQTLCVVYVTLIWATREAEVILLFAGQLGCEAANWALKRYIKEERPREMNGKGYGMPSSHAQFLSFFATSLLLFLLQRHRPRTHTHSAPSTLPERVVLSALVLALAAAVAASRVYLNYHSRRQVVAGAAAGVVLALAWWVVTEGARRMGLVAWAVDSDVGRALRIRDLVMSEDLPEAGWAKWVEMKRGNAKAGWGNGAVAAGGGKGVKSGRKNR